MKKNKIYSAIICLIMALFISKSVIYAQNENDKLRQAPGPLYNNPIYDGAADPVLIWNREEKSWWMFYTTRRANLPIMEIE